MPLTLPEIPEAENTPLVRQLNSVRHEICANHYIIDISRLFTIGCDSC